MGAGHSDVKSRTTSMSFEDHIKRCEPWFKQQYAGIIAQWKKAQQDGMSGNTLPYELTELQVPYHNSIFCILREALDNSRESRDGRINYSRFQALVMNKMDLIMDNIAEMNKVVRQGRQAVKDVRHRRQDVKMQRFVETHGGGRATSSSSSSGRASGSGGYQQIPAGVIKKATIKRTLENKRDTIKKTVSREVTLRKR